MEAEMKYRETSHYYSNKFMRNSKAVGVLWGIFTVCYAIITIVVFMQVGQVQAFCQFLWDVVFVLSFDANIFLCFQAKDGSEPYISWWIFRLPLRKELHSGQTKGLSTLFTWASLRKCNAGVVAVVFCCEFQSFVFVFASLFVFVIWPRGMQRCCFQPQAQEFHTF